MNRTSSTPAQAHHEVLELDSGLMGIKYQSGMSLTEILQAFGVAEGKRESVGRQLLSGNGLMMIEGELRTNRNKPLARGTIIQLSKQHVTKVARPRIDDANTKKVEKPPIAPPVAAMGVVAELKRDFRALLDDPTSRRLLYGGMALSVAMGVGFATFLALDDQPKRASSIKYRKPLVPEKTAEKEVDEEEDEELVSETPTATPAPTSPASGGVTETASSAVPSVPKTGQSEQKVFVFTNQTSITELRKAIDELNAQDKRRVGP